MDPLAWAGGCGACWAAVILSWKRCTKPAIKKKIARHISDSGTKALAGSQLDIGEITFSLGRTSTVIVNDIKVGNPEGYKAEKLVSIKSTAVAIDVAGAMRMALRSCGKPEEIRIVSIIVNGLEFIFEKKSVMDSNLNALLVNMKESEREVKEAVAEEDKPEEKGMFNSVTNVVENVSDMTDGIKTKILQTPSPTNGSDKKQRVPVVTVELVELSDLHVEITSTTQIDSKIKGRKMPIKDFRFEHFSKEVGETSFRKMVHYLVEDVMVNVLKTIGAPINKCIEMIRDSKDGEEDNTDEGSWLDLSYCVLL